MFRYSYYYCCCSLDMLFLDKFTHFQHVTFYYYYMFKSKYYKRQTKNMIFFPSFDVSIVAAVKLKASFWYYSWCVYISPYTHMYTIQNKKKKRVDLFPLFFATFSYKKSQPKANRSRLKLIHRKISLMLYRNVCTYTCLIHSVNIQVEVKM